MQYYFKRFFVLHSSEDTFSFVIKKSGQKVIEIEIAFFIPLGIPRVGHWIISFMLHIQTDELVEIFLKLPMKTVQVPLIIGTTLGLLWYTIFSSEKQYTVMW